MQSTDFLKTLMTIAVAGCCVAGCSATVEPETPLAPLNLLTYNQTTSQSSAELSSPSSPAMLSVQPIGKAPVMSSSPQGLKLTLDDGSFEQNKADLLPITLTSIDELAMLLNKNPQRTVVVEPYSGRGTDYNLGFSERRAHSVRFALMERGIPSNRIVVKKPHSSAISNNRQQAPVELTVVDSNKNFYY